MTYNYDSSMSSKRMDDGCTVVHHARLLLLHNVAEGFKDCMACSTDLAEDPSLLSDTQESIKDE